MKIYIHHYYTDHLFFLLAHNTTDRIFDLKNDIGLVECRYKGVKFELIFNPIISDEEDGFHYIDFTTARSQSNRDKKFYLIEENKRNGIIDSVDDAVNNALYNLTNIIKNKPNWIFSFFSGEKSFYKHENFHYYNGMEAYYDLEKSLLKLNNCKIITEEFFIKDEIYAKYPNLFYTFSNSIWYWNNHAEIRWYYEFKKIFEKLTFDYDLSYSVRAYKYHRIALLNELKKINNKKLYLQRSDARKDSEGYITNAAKVSDIYLNSEIGITDFDNLRLVNKQRLGLDLFFRMLPKAKMHLLDESWSFHKNDFTSQYLSEKTIGFILSSIPFISTHSYPLEIVEKLLEVKPHPFFKETKEIQGNPFLISQFINTFLKNYEDNYELCKKWVQLCHEKMIEKIIEENSLFDFLLNDFEKNIQINTKLF